MGFGVKGWIRLKYPTCKIASAFLEYKKNKFWFAWPKDIQVFFKTLWILFSRSVFNKHIVFVLVQSHWEDHHMARPQEDHDALGDPDGSAQSSFQQRQHTAALHGPISTQPRWVPPSSPHSPFLMKTRALLNCFQSAEKELNELCYRCLPCVTPMFNGPWHSHRHEMLQIWCGIGMIFLDFNRCKVFVF